MIAQERTLFWQVVRLRLRTWTGWGNDVPKLRQNARVNARVARVFPFAMVLYVALYIVIFSVLPQMGVGRAHPAPLPFTVRISLLIIAPLFALMVVAAGLSVAYSRRADVGEDQPPTTLDGSCFATVIAPPTRLFARIGITREQAQWFCLPIDWDATVEPCGDRFELTYNPVTGYVERLRRIGAEPHELTQAAETPSDGDETAAAGAMAGENGEATPAQQRELKRAARRAGMAWGVSNRTLLSDGLAFVVSGASFIAMIVVVLVVLRAYPQPHAETSTTLAIIVFCGVFGIIGIGLFVLAARMLRLWARRRGEVAPPIAIEGARVCWAPYRDMYSLRNESLALIRLDDGSELVFHIPGRWAHRLWSASSRVRVTYDATSGYVVDYRVVAPA